MSRTLTTGAAIRVYWFRKREVQQSFELADSNKDGAISMQELQAAARESSENRDVLEQVWMSWSGAMAAAGVLEPTKLRRSGWRKLGLPDIPALDAALFSMSFIGAKGAAQESRSIWRPRRTPPTSFSGTSTVINRLEERGECTLDSSLLAVIWRMDSCCTLSCCSRPLWLSKTRLGWDRGKAVCVCAAVSFETQELDGRTS